MTAASLDRLVGLAMDEARLAGQAGDIPIGAVVVDAAGVAD